MRNMPVKSFIKFYAIQTIVGTLSIVVLPYPQGIYAKTPSGCLKWQIILNPMYIMFSPTNIYL